MMVQVIVFEVTARAFTLPRRKGELRDKNRAVAVRSINMPVRNRRNG